LPQGKNFGFAEGAVTPGAVAGGFAFSVEFFVEDVVVEVQGLHYSRHKQVLVFFLQLQGIFFDELLE